ncbi:MAG: bifunctional UDP-N-acetylglucosamine diphosphorylase/glucosamine-1-phosphate N-acetyltransferase GlmU [Polyangiales bacterium]
MNFPRTVVVLAAGQGTRMKSALPKVLHPIAGAPMVTFAIDAALALEPERVVVVVGHGRELVESQVRARFGDRVTFALQQSQRGTADAVRSALSSIPETSREVIITYGDCPLVPGAFLQKLVEARVAANALVSVATTELDDPTGYGRMLRDGAGRITAIREHKDCTPQEREIRVINAGLYAVDRAFLERALSAIDSSNAQGEFYLTDLVSLADRESPNGTPVVELRGRQDLLRGINDRAELADAEAHMLEAINDRWRRAGNSIARGARIERDVVLDQDVTVGQGAVLRGKTRIESNVTVDVGCVLDDAIVRERAMLKPYTIVSKSEIGPGAQLGPFAHIRPDSVVGENAHVGNFVELKKTRMDKGAKANHLAYLGDGVVGEAANIGAGTIFCNYDGFSKNTTTVGAGAFVGSNSALVAPVTIGEGAYVGSGSVVTQDVPKDALALGRAKQENKLGWVPKYRALKKK